MHEEGAAAHLYFEGKQHFRLGGFLFLLKERFVHSAVCEIECQSIASDAQRDTSCLAARAPLLAPGLAPSRQLTRSESEPMSRHSLANHHIAGAEQASAAAAANSVTRLELSCLREMVAQQI